MVLFASLIAFVPFATALQIPFFASERQERFADAPPPTTLSAASRPVSFTLRQAVHVSTTNRSMPALYRHYSEEDRSAMTIQSGHSQTQSLSALVTTTWKPSSHAAYQAARRSAYWAKRAMRSGVLPSWAEIQDQVLGRTLEWEEEDILMPNITDVGTIAALAKMASNAYSKENSASWWDLDGRWNVVSARMRFGLAQADRG